MLNLNQMNGLQTSYEKMDMWEEHLEEYVLFNQISTIGRYEILERIKREKITY